MKKLLILLASTMLLASCGAATNTSVEPVSGENPTSTEPESSEEDTRKINAVWTDDMARTVYNAGVKSVTSLDRGAIGISLEDVHTSFVLSSFHQETHNSVVQEAEEANILSGAIDLDLLAVGVAFDGLLTATSMDDVKAMAREEIRGQYVLTDEVAKASYEETGEEDGEYPYEAIGSIDFSAQEELQNSNLYAYIPAAGRMSLAKGVLNIVTKLFANEPVAQMVGGFASMLAEEECDMFPFEKSLIGSLSEFTEVPATLPARPLEMIPTYEQSGLGEKIEEFFTTGIGANQALDFGDVISYEKIEGEEVTTHRLSTNAEAIVSFVTKLGLEASMFAEMIPALDVDFDIDINKDGTIKDIAFTVNRLVLHNLAVSSYSSYTYAEDGVTYEEGYKDAQYLNASFNGTLRLAFNYAGPDYSSAEELETYQLNEYLNGMIKSFLPSSEPTSEEIE